MAEGLEAELRARFDVREERFDHGGLGADVLMPTRPDLLIDQAEFDRDERLPYWAELWPAARGLARHLLDNPPPERRALELGCGVALPSLALKYLGLDVTASDYYEDALAFARANAQRNGLGALATLNLDWREPPEGAWPLVVAADVLYEMRNSEALAALLPRIVAPGGRALVADPGRMYEWDFRDLLKKRGWHAEQIDLRREINDPVKQVASTITIFEVRRVSA
ncbi:MAG TPA: methyltransferase domain-containing protein [Longimicrobium sp.]|nr:methyltransferase domain-containing protein [Longimicrobium sp.]